MNWFTRLKVAASISLNKAQLLALKYKVRPEYVIAVGDEFDPTGRGIYTEWLIRQLSYGQALPSTVYSLLSLYDRLKNAPGFSPKDINEIKSVNDLRTIVETGRVSKAEYLRNQAKSGHSVVYQDGQYQVISVTTPAAATELCKDSDICIKDPKFFSRYNMGSGNPVYIVMKHDSSGSSYINLGKPNYQRYAVFFPNTGEFNCFDNQSIFEHGLGREMYGLFQKVDSGMISIFLDRMIEACESQRGWAKFGHVLGMALEQFHATEEQRKRAANIIGMPDYEGESAAYDPGNPQYNQPVDDNENPF